MELRRSTLEAYVHQAYDLMLAVAERVGDERVSEKPLGPQTNSVAALITHCCGLTEFWIGHVALGRPTNRDRDAEFTARATVAELRAMVEATVAQTVDDLGRVDKGEADIDPSYCDGLAGDDATDAGVVLHVLEELYQHLGHMELAADALTR